MGYLPLWAGWTILFVLVGLLIWSLLYQWKLVRPGHEGLLIVLGNYRRTLGPGRHFIRPGLFLLIVPAGTTVKFHVGQNGVVTSRVSGSDEPGKVQAGEDIFDALPIRRGRSFERGTAVRVVGAKPPNTVYIAAAAQGPNTP